MACRMRSGITTAQALASGSHIALLALAGERLAATGGLDLRREMPSYHNPAGLSGHIMNIWTDPAFRGRGDRMADAGSPHGSGL